VVLDLDNSSRALHRVGGRSWSLNGGQNRYSYDTAFTFVGFDGEIVGLKPPRFRLGIPRWCPPCSLETAFEIKTQAKAKFHMYLFVLL
jgi:hypothetical protein